MTNEERIVLLERRRNVLDNSFGYSSFRDGLTRDEIVDIDSRIAVIRAMANKTAEG